MSDEKDPLPSDAENGSLEPRKPEGGQPSEPRPDEKKVEEDPSEQPS